MTPATDTRIADALMQLERTRTQLVLRCAGGSSEPNADAGLAPTAPELVGLLDTVFTEGLADDWIARHPWASVAAGLLAGGLAVSQRQRLIRWAVAHALPWLTSQAAVMAAPLLAQWLSCQAAQASTDEANAAAGTKAAQAPDTTGLSEPNSPTARSPA